MFKLAIVAMGMTLAASAAAQAPAGAPIPPAEAAYRATAERADRAFRAGDLSEALRLTEEARAVAEVRLGPSHQLAFESLNDISVLHQLRGNLQAAVSPALSAAGGLERVAGPDHPETLNALANLAQLWVRLERKTEAEPLLRRVYEARERSLGLSNEATLFALLEWAIFLHRERRLAEIKPQLERGAETARTALGADHVVARDLADALRAAG